MIISDIDFEKVIECIKRQPVEDFIRRGRMGEFLACDREIIRILSQFNVKTIYKEKERVYTKHKKKLSCLYRTSRYPHLKIKRELRKIATFIIKNEYNIIRMKYRDWLFDFILVGQIWGNAETLKLYLKKCNQLDCELRIIPKA